MKAYNVTNRYKNTLGYSITMPATKEELELYNDKKLFKLTGKSIVLRGSDNYTTSNVLEIEFLRKLSGVMMTELDEKATQEILKMGPSPMVGVSLTDNEANQFKYKDINEDEVIANLIKLGYISNTSKVLIGLKDGKLEEITEELMAERLKELGWTLYKKGHLTAKSKTPKTKKEK